MCLYVSPSSGFKCGFEEEAVKSPDDDALRSKGVRTRLKSGEMLVYMGCRKKWIFKNQDS